jgi:polysaccharide pyruvyl transferase WcaK-like protein
VTAGAPARRASGLRIGFFGRLASGNIGNDVSMESVLAFLRADHADAVLDAMCNGPEAMRDRYGIEATQLFWRAPGAGRAPKPAKAAFLAVEKVIDTVRIMRWVQRHDVVIVPGMGVLEAILPLRPWETPYSLFMLSLSGRLFRTRVALVSVGASPAKVRATRWLQNWTARLASYVSYRDTYSRDSMRERGVDTSRSPLYPDLVFSLPVPPHDPGQELTVGVGVMQYSGSDDERSRAAEINATYLAGMKRFTRWLVDNGYRVVLFTGDADDRPVADAILASLRETRPELADAAAVSPVSTFAELTDAMQPVSAVVVTRFHNVICALRLGKPTIALGYGSKSAAVMADAGLSDFNLSANPLDADQLIARFEELRARAADLRPAILESSAVKARLLDDQFARLSKEVFPA